jgi:sulfur carrier protein ThiS
MMRTSDQQQQPMMPERPKIKLRYLNNADGGFAQTVEVYEDTTVGEFCDRQGVDVDQSTIKVNHEIVQPDDVLEDGDRIMVTPRNVKGA